MTTHSHARTAAALAEEAGAINDLHLSAAQRSLTQQRPSPPHPQPSPPTPEATHPTPVRRNPRLETPPAPPTPLARPRRPATSPPPVPDQT